MVLFPQAEEADEKEATPPAVEEMPVAKRAAATAARPKRAAAAAAQRAIAATAVKRPRGRHMSGASIASVPGRDLRAVMRLHHNHSSCGHFISGRRGRLQQPRSAQSQPRR